MAEVEMAEPLLTEPDRTVLDKINVELRENVVAVLEKMCFSLDKNHKLEVRTKLQRLKSQNKALKNKISHLTVENRRLKKALENIKSETSNAAAGVDE